jgi:hypothetical protein
MHGTLYLPVTGQNFPAVSVVTGLDFPAGSVVTGLDFPAGSVVTGLYFSAGSVHCKKVNRFSRPQHGCH